MSSSAFIQAMDQTNHLQRGENNAAEYTASGVQESRVALFFALVRDMSDERLHELIHLVLRDGTDNEEIIADLFIMLFQTRHCRGGKGEKDLFYRMLMEIAPLYPDTISSLLKLAPYYGSYKDWFNIITWSRDTEKIKNDEIRRAMVGISETIMNMVCDQLRKDEEILNKGLPSKKVSLLAKWCPREKHAMHDLAKELASKLFPHSNIQKKEYRKLISRLNNAIKTLEIKMSNNQWDDIDFTKDVSSLALMKYRKAFLNENVKGEPPGLDEDETGNRHPDDVRRVECRKRLRETIASVAADKLKGKQLYPHEITSKFKNGHKKLSHLEKDILSCQWKDIRESVIEAMSKVQDIKEEEEDSGSTVNLGNLVSLVDVSGSMSGIPMEVAIALGILVSEVASPDFCNRCLTFSSVPEWVELHQAMTLEEKVQKMVRAPWGMNTDFEAATEKILDIAVKAKLKPSDIPDLIVFSDMQFDEARRSNDYDNYDNYDNNKSDPENDWETHHERIVRRFKEEGLKACGEEWPAPHIIYWNLRGNTSGYPAKADTPGVTMLSGYSPSLMKLILSGEPVVDEAEEEVIDENGVTTIKKVKKNPFDTIRKALDDEEYDKVREVLYASQEGILKKYNKPIVVDKEEEKVVKKVKDDGDWEIVA